MDSLTADANTSCRASLSDFFRSLSSAKPRWVSILHPVNGSEESCLTHLLGFEHHVGLQYLVVTGLIEKGSIQNPVGYVVVPHEWEKFVIKENLKDSIETSATITLVLHSRYYFIHYGHKDKLHHQPIDQYNGKSSQTSSFQFLPPKQKKLHKQISNKLVTMHADSKAYNSAQGLDEVVEEEPIFEVVTDDVANKVPAGCWEEYTDLNGGKTPTLCRFLIKRNRYNQVTCGNIWRAGIYFRKG